MIYLYPLVFGTGYVASRDSLVFCDDVSESSCECVHLQFMCIFQ